MLRFIPIGGIGGVTKNMYVYEYQNQILVVDCGIGFPDATMLGVDLLIPDVSYLEARKDKIVGMVLTHGHDDHIAGLPYILPRLGQIPIYGSKLTIGFAKERLADFNVSANMQLLPDDQPLRLGPFNLEAVKVTHSVPDSRHVAITTPEGVMYHGPDFKFDLSPVDNVLPEFQKMAAVGRRGVLCLLSDCLRSEKPGWSLSESILAQTFEREIRDARGKFIVTAMSSNVHRIQQAIDVAARHGRKIALVGRSIESNVMTAVRLGLMRLPEKMMIKKQRIKHLRPAEVCVIIAGSQGQPGSSLVRAVEEEHDFVTINPEDKVVFSTEPIPGSESAVYATIDSLSKQGVDVAYSDVDDALHVSGHGYSGEQKLLMALLKPKYLIPIGGTFRHMVQYRKLAADLGYKPEQVMLLEDGQVVEFNQGQARKAELVPLKNVMVDGLGIGDVGKIVLRDRKTMAKEGIVVVMVPVSQQTGQVGGEVEVISRGFVFMKESQALVEQIKEKVKLSLPTRGMVTDWQGVRKNIEERLGEFLYAETGRSPLILTVVMEV
jgi:ribonuclease J